MIGRPTRVLHESTRYPHAVVHPHREWRPQHRGPGAALHRHFAHQASGDPDDIGVCVTLLTEHLGLSQPTVSRHLDILRRAGFVNVTRIGRWSYYARNSEQIEEFTGWLDRSL